MAARGEADVCNAARAYGAHKVCFVCVIGLLGFVARLVVVVIVNEGKEFCVLHQDIIILVFSLYDGHGRRRTRSGSVIVIGSSSVAGVDLTTDGADLDQVEIG